MKKLLVFNLKKNSYSIVIEGQKNEYDFLILCINLLTIILILLLTINYFE